MRALARLVAIVLAIMILVATPCAFWAFNLSRVVMNSQTYKTALNSQSFYANVVPALIDAAARSASDGSAKGDAKFTQFLRGLSQEDAVRISNNLVPPEWLRAQIEGNIDQFFAWIDGSVPTPDIRFDLSELKKQLTNRENLNVVSDIVITSLPACNQDQLATLRAMSQAQSKEFGQLPACNPQNDNLRRYSSDVVSNALVEIAKTLPNNWNLLQQLRQAETQGGPSDVGTLELARFRAEIWLLSRLTALLFLIPVALLALIVMVTIRSFRTLFRWTGWIVIISGLIAMVPVVLMPVRLAAIFSGSVETGVEQGFGESGPLLYSLLLGMLNSIDSQIALSILPQLIAVIFTGFVAVGLSILLPPPEPFVEKWQVMVEQQAAAGQQPGSPPGRAPNPLAQSGPPHV